MTDRCILINALAKEGWLLIDCVYHENSSTGYPILIEEWLKDGQVLETRSRCVYSDRGMEPYYAAHYSSIGSKTREEWNGNSLPLILKAIRGEK